MAFSAAVQFLIDDHGDKSPPSGFRKTFAGDDAYKSILQRNGKTLEEVLQLFDWTPEDAAWLQEYGKPDPIVAKLIKYRKGIDFQVSVWRDLQEDLGQFDVSCLRSIRMPYVTSRTPLRVLKEEANG